MRRNERVSCLDNEEECGLYLGKILFLYQTNKQLVACSGTSKMNLEHGCNKTMQFGNKKQSNV